MKDQTYLLYNVFKVNGKHNVKLTVKIFYDENPENPKELAFNDRIKEGLLITASTIMKNLNLSLLFTTLSFTVASFYFFYCILLYVSR